MEHNKYKSDISNNRIAEGKDQDYYVFPIESKTAFIALTYVEFSLVILLVLIYIQKMKKI